MRGPGSLQVKEEIVEVRFKHKRKEYFRNARAIRLEQGDRVVVEAEKGFDLGTVSLAGESAGEQLRKIQALGNSSSLKQIYRKAGEADLEKWLSSKRRERRVLLEARTIAHRLNLQMSIGEVEFRADGRKVTLYYQAGGGVDVEALHRTYASAFQVGIEMRQG
jgi:cell fate regulator YaaT (PSP1 superfamily)